MIDSFLRWVREECRLMALDSWADGAYHGPPDPEPCTSSHPDCARLLERQREVSEKMRRMKSRLIDSADRPYTSAAHTDIRHICAEIRRVTEPPVQLVKRGKA